MRGTVLWYCGTVLMVEALRHSEDSLQGMGTLFLKRYLTVLACKRMAGRANTESAP